MTPGSSAVGPRSIQPAAQHLLQGGVERAVGQQPAPAEQQVEPLAQLVAVQGSTRAAARGLPARGSPPRVPWTCPSRLSAMRWCRSYRGERIAIDISSATGATTAARDSRRCAWCGRPRTLVPTCGARGRSGPGCVTPTPDRQPPASPEPVECQAQGRTAPPSRASRGRKPASRQQPRARGAKVLQVAARSSAAGRRACVLVGRLRLPLQDHRHPGPEQGLPDPDVVRLLRRRQDRARPVRHAEPRVDPAHGRCRRTCRTRWSPPRTAPSGPTGHRPQGHPPRGVQQRPRQRDPGCLHDHPAVRQDPLPHPGALLHAQGQGGDPVAEDPAAASKDEILEGYLNTIYFGRGAYGIQAAAQAYFGKDAKDLTLQRERGAASVLNNPTHFDPANGKDAKQALLGALPLRPRRHGRRWATSPPTRPTQARAAAAEVPEDQGATSQYGGQKGHMLTLVKQRAAPARLHRRGDRRRRPAGHHHVHPKAMDGGRAGRAEAAAEGQLTRSCTSRSPRWSPDGALLGSTAARTTSSSQINWAERGRHGRARRSSRSRWPPALDDGYSLKEHLRRQLAVRLPRRHARCATRAPGDGTDYGSAVTADHGDRGVDQHRLRRHDRSRCPNGPQKILDDGQRDGHPAANRHDYPGIPSSRDLEPTR